MSDTTAKCPECKNEFLVEENLSQGFLTCPDCSFIIPQPVPGLEAGMEVGDFRLVRRIGIGGMGEVWLAEQPTMDRSVALKILSPALTKEKKFVNRFMKEVKTSAKLTHPYIVTALHAGIDKGFYYLAISYIDGMELRQYLDIYGTLEELMALQIAKRTAEALQYAWKKFKIIHRDIKPANIMLDSETGESYLMDMGISKSVSESSDLTLTGTIVGTPFYMSPEHARMDDEIDCRTDIYSLGATLFHILSGAVPYDAPNPVAIISKLLAEPLPSPQSRNPDISDECTILIEKMMEKLPEDRQQSWDEVIKDIDNVLEGNSPSPTKKKHGSKVIKVKMESSIDPEKETSSKYETILKDPEVKEFLCPHCDAVNNTGANFCNECGKGMTQSCPECSEDLLLNLKYCTKCGTDIERLKDFEDILKKLKDYQKGGKWQLISNESIDLDDCRELSGMKAARMISEIKEIFSEASGALNMESDYKDLCELVDKCNNDKKYIDSFKALQAFLVQYPKSGYVSEIKTRLEKIRKISYDGPSLYDEWLLPELKIKFISIPPGEFIMGSSSGNLLGLGGELGRQKNEGPLHKVTLSNPFWMAECPITIEQYLLFYASHKIGTGTLWTSKKCSPEKAGKDSSISNGCWGDMNNPMIDVTWLNASEFCKWLNLVEMKNNRLPDGYIYRLPTEAEWEYCCRAGTQTRYSFGDDENALDEYAWYDRNSKGRSHPVKDKKPNPWALFDMHGNVWEWCNDKYGSYSAEANVDPVGSQAGEAYVRRGGSWINGNAHCRSAYRNSWEKKYGFEYLGFRIVLAHRKTTKSSFEG